MRFALLNRIQGIRTLSLLIALFAALLAAAREGNRLLKLRAHYLDVALIHASRRYDWEEGNVCLKEEIEESMSRQELQSYTNLHIKYYLGMEAKYRQAAAHPWQKINPDPPVPNDLPLPSRP